jgi:hypothetical protein
MVRRYTMSSWEAIGGDAPFGNADGGIVEAKFPTVTTSFPYAPVDETSTDFFPPTFLSSVWAIMQG